MNYKLDWHDKQAFEDALDMYSQVHGKNRIKHEYITNEFYEKWIQVCISCKSTEDMFLFGLLFNDLRRNMEDYKVENTNDENILVCIKRRFYKMLTIFIIFFSLLFTLLAVYAYFLPTEKRYETTLFKNDQ